MKRTLWKLFPFTAIDSKAAEAWLNRLGEQGWRLGSAGLYTARFWQTGEPVSYAVTPEQGRREDFLVLCRDAGWELAARSRKMELYASRAGACPIPLETDQALECRSFLRRGIRWLALEAALTLMFLLNLRQLLDTGGPTDWPALVLWLGELALWGGCLAGDGIVSCGGSVGQYGGIFAGPWPGGAGGGNLFPTGKNYGTVFPEGCPAAGCADFYPVLYPGQPQRPADICVGTD